MTGRIEKHAKDGRFRIARYIDPATCRPGHFSAGLWELDAGYTAGGLRFVFDIYRTAPDEAAARAWVDALPDEVVP